MFKLVVLSALLAVAAARPGHLLESSPLVYAAPATTIVQEPVLAKVGAVVKSVPTAVSHQSQSVVHSSAHIVEDVVAPVVKSTPVVSYAAAAPVVHTSYAAAAPVVHSTYAAAAPVVHSTYAAAAPVLASTYAAVAPVAHVAASSPLTYTATGVW
ncbi:larval/pupal cuticle protein H1C [Drosophila kikkawai]|uniref:Larval/pupal cuticle protein H1C n=1 Tax=Drosophila kikkawai TaxID=30033 RepID=A0A6P4JKF4_DROKI|nr:cuticle protein LPCP-23 [Drosophila kikkawai]